MTLPSQAEFYALMASFDRGYHTLWGIVAFAALIMWFVWRGRITARPLSLSSSKRFWMYILGAATIIRLPRLFKSFWYDETFTSAMTSTPLTDFPTALLGDVHPPLDYLIRRLSVSLLGNSEVALRLPSLIAGLLLIYVMYRLAKQISGDETVATLTALITAFLPMTLHYSGEARYPMLLTLAVLTAASELLSPKSKRTWLFVGCTIAAALLHSIGFIYAGLLAVMALVIGTTMHWRLAGLIGGAGALLWLPGILIQSGDVSDGFWLPLQLPLWHLTDMTVGSNHLAATTLIILSLAILITCLSVPYALRKITGWRPLVVVLGIGFVVPMAVWTISLIYAPIYLTRALMPSALITVIGWAWLARDYRFARLLLLVLIPLSLVSYFAMDTKPTLRDVFSTCNGADVTYTTSTSVTIMNLHYGSGQRVGWTDGNNLHQSLTPDAKDALGMTLVDDPDDLTGAVCVISQLSYNTRPGEVEHLETIIADHPDGTRTDITIDRMFRYVIYRYEH